LRRICRDPGAGAGIGHSRAVSTRYDKRAYVFTGTLASIRLWLKN
jgi:hypothetical protein